MNQEISISEPFRFIREIMSSDVEVKIDSAGLRPAESEVQRLPCDNRKLRDAQGFHPVLPLREGPKQTIDWLQDPDNRRRYKGSFYNV
jgi:nucleoside-diphosphate-sugar epimerase